MSRITKTITLSLPPQMVRAVDRLMKSEGRSRSELFREALRRYIEEKEWKEVLRYGEKRARALGITPDQVEDIVDSYRK